MTSTTVQNVTRFFNGESLSSIFSDRVVREKDKTINEIYNYTPDQLEDDHSFIQWVFPTPRASIYNSNSPILSMDDIFVLKKNERIIKWLTLFRDKIFGYWGLYPKDSNRVYLLNGHNGLRFSRAIECLTLFGIDVTYVFDTVMYFINNGIVTPRYEIYEGKNTPIWFIRYHESLLKRWELVLRYY